jgi:maltose-binding protein MalE
MKSSLESFAAGKTAMVFGYKSDLAEINKRNPFLRVGVMPMPQVSVIEAQSLGGANSSSNSAVAYPRYVGLVVSRQSKAAEWAWDFIVRATTSDAAMGAYLAASDKPPALRSLIAQKIGNPTFDVFARQALIARSWRIPDDEKVRNAMDGAIRSVLTGQTDSKTALKRAADQVTQLIKEAAR